MGEKKEVEIEAVKEGEMMEVKEEVEGEEEEVVEVVELVEEKDGGGGALGLSGRRKRRRRRCSISRCCTAALQTWSVFKLHCCSGALSQARTDGSVCLAPWWLAT